jgi:phage shock protein E
MTTSRPVTPIRVVSALAASALLLAGCDSAGASEDAAEARAEVSAPADEMVPRLAPDEVVELLERDPDVVLLDVRTPEEVAEGALAGATVIDLQGPDFEQQVDALDPDATYAIYCRSGNRSGQAAEVMRDRGFSDLYNAGAYADLEAAGLATDR